jgi:hypothetical protein
MSNVDRRQKLGGTQVIAKSKSPSLVKYVKHVALNKVLIIH